MSLSSHPPPSPTGSLTGSLTVPAIPQRPERAPFPLIASVAPVVAACAIWLLTGSPFVLLFAALGPVVAVAGMLDGRRHNRKTVRRASARFSRQLAALGEQLELRHAEERRVAGQLTPSALDIAAGGEDAGRWQGSEPGLVSVGRGPTPSAVRLDAGALDRDPGDLDPAGWAALSAVRELCDRAETVQNAPVPIPLSGGLGVIGPAALARPVVRGLLLQFLRTAHPGSVALRLPLGEEWAWAGALQRSAPDAPGSVRLLLVDRADVLPQPATAADKSAGAPAIAPVENGQVNDGPAEDNPAGAGEPLLAVAGSLEALPPGCQSILRVESARSALLLRARGGVVSVQLVPELLGRQQAAVVAARLAEAAQTAGLVRTTGRLPQLVRLHTLERFGWHGAGLSCVLGVSQHGPIELDLVANGPHALIGGTTGSGKSELLVSWVLSLAAAYPPDELAVLLVDFKGGSAFGELARLPHCVGLLTDLDEAEAARALASLQAELRHRERTLRAVRAREIDDPAVRGQLPRLVIVVDEFAAMLGSAPELHAVFVDIAARGRSLGMHLILCTQRPAGVVRDALLANCTLRVSLRVNNREDSRATIGTDAAALLPPAKPGRAIVAAGDGRLIEFQSAISRSEELERAGGLVPGAEELAAAGVRRPWLPPLPERLSLAEVAGLLLDPEREPDSGAVLAAGQSAVHSFTLGIVDEPALQRRRRARWTPAEDGPLLILGAARSGRSAVLGALGAQAPAGGWAVQRCGAEDPEGYWDALVGAAAPQPGSTPRPGAPFVGSGRRLLLFDDWDAVLARWPVEYQAEASELLGIALRDGQRTGCAIVLAARGVSGAVQTHRALFDATLLLRQAEKGEHLRAGGLAATWRQSAPAGRGEWRGLEVQCARAGESTVGLSAADSPAHDPVLQLEDGVLLVLSGAPARALSALQEGAASAGYPSGSVVELRELDLLTAGPPDGVRVIVGDPDGWQARWGLFSELRPRSRLLLHECRLSEFRTLARLRELPPLLTPAGGNARGILIEADGRPQRVRIG
ncbi:FtsK/SpoIIIE domain-containing protein [Microterricola viridarii]|uniref:FtsK domain-containing protein n=1 Tax=Microterricola viridarii TaxID=412690 RepID=A0A0Y0MU27_9MICO|nr:FtsK/SpoIIIE domain-containing protein [Microterricola viridarii]AMB57982.1 hypothetical protein AWU67_02860 [Microterricola viridarii]